MKKNYTFYAILLAFPVVAMIVSSFSSAGSFGSSLTGSPGDGSSCTNCHFGGPVNGDTNITLNVPATYSPGTTYNLTLDASAVVTSNRNGFHLTVEDQAGTKQGTFVAGSDTQNLSGSQTISHASASATGVWSFQWTAPATNQGDLTFWSAINASNGNFSNGAGDVIYLNGFDAPVLSSAELALAQFQMYPNPTVDQLRVDLPQGIASAEAIVYNYVGAELIRQQVTFANNSISVAQLQAGAYLLSLNAEGAQQTKAFVKR